VTWDPVDVATQQPYQVVIGSGASRLLPEFLAGVDRVAIIHASSLAERAARLAASLDACVTLIGVPDGESAKTPQVLIDCWTALAAAGFTRSDMIVGLGGGSATDLAGFVASSWLRGVRYVGLPTTVLAMVDAAVGGKTGINLEAGKNLVGAFYEPEGVLCDLDFLASLPAAEVASGMAEVLKCGLIADPAILDEFEADPAEALTAASDRQRRLIRRAVAVKAKVVAADFREATSEGEQIGRELLNYGHTLGHAIEKVEDFGWRHGEAISVGMVFAAELAHRSGLIGDDLVARHRRVLTLAGLPTSYSGWSWPELRAAMSLDKKTRGHSLRFVVLTGLAKARVLVEPDEDVLETSYSALADA
jgi:3-dehydroquinate synthase